ncbi:MAG: hypothetical protein IPO92_00590 [Saprospiraceae bacterium]|nr:hypothetical protein [Saprospiraceae bacterium]
MLGDALKSIDGILSADDAKADPEAWNSKGQIYNEIAKTEINKKILDPSFVIPTPDAALIALESFEKAISLALKKSHTKDALAGIKEDEEYLNNIGITQFQVQDYNNSFKNFSGSLKASEVLKANKEDTRLSVDTIMSDQVFYTGVSAYYGDNKEASIPFFEKLYKAGKAQSLVYEALFNLISEKDVTKAMEYLEAGRKAYPDDSGLLFAEINYYLKVGKLDILTSKLKAAIAKEPDNVSVYVTLGNVYDQINQKERAEGNAEKADENLNLALDYFNQALAKDPKNFDAKYSQGALYYNKAASMTSKLNELSNDYSSAGTKKYNIIKLEMDGYFKTALPYFIEAEQLDPKDLNTKIALKEIYARDGKLDKAAEYKAKIEALGNN